MKRRVSKFEAAVFWIAFVFGALVLVWAMICVAVSLL
jgi:hypothetical protein